MANLGGRFSVAKDKKDRVVSGQKKFPGTTYRFHNNSKADAKIIMDTVVEDLPRGNSLRIPYIGTAIDIQAINGFVRGTYEIEELDTTPDNNPLQFRIDPGMTSKPLTKPGNFPRPILYRFHNNSKADAEIIMDSKKAADLSPGGTADVYTYGTEIFIKSLSTDQILEGVFDKIKDWNE